MRWILTAKELGVVRREVKVRISEWPKIVTCRICY